MTPWEGKWSSVEEPVKCQGALINRITFGISNFVKSLESAGFVFTNTSYKGELCLSVCYRGWTVFDLIWRVGSISQDLTYFFTKIHLYIDIG